MSAAAADNDKDFTARKLSFDEQRIYNQQLTALQHVLRDLKWTDGEQVERLHIGDGVIQPALGIGIKGRPERIYVIICSLAQEEEGADGRLVTVQIQTLDTAPDVLEKCKTTLARLAVYPSSTVVYTVLWFELAAILRRSADR